MMLDGKRQKTVQSMLLCRTGTHFEQRKMLVCVRGTVFLGRAPESESSLITCNSE